MSMRLTLASSTYSRQATPTGTSSAQASAALIGLTWVTTTTTESPAGPTSSAHASATRRPTDATDSPPSGA